MSAIAAPLSGTAFGPRWIRRARRLAYAQRPAGATAFWTEVPERESPIGRGQAVQVATTARKLKGKVLTSYLLRRTYREDGKVKHESLGNLSHLPLPIIDKVREAVPGETYVPVDTVVQIQHSVPHGHVTAVLGTLRRLELDRIIGTRRTRQRDLVLP